MDELVVGVGSLEVIDLPLEISLLMGAADSGVDDASSLGLGLGSLSSGIMGGEDPVELLAGVEPLATWEPDHSELSVICPGSKRRFRDAIGLLYYRGWYVPGLVYLVSLRGSRRRLN